MEDNTSAPFSQHSGAGVDSRVSGKKSRTSGPIIEKWFSKKTELQSKSGVQRDRKSAGLGPPLLIQSSVRDQNIPSALAASEMGL